MADKPVVTFLPGQRGRDTMKRVLVLVALIMASCCNQGAKAASNVTLGKAVELHGGPFFAGGWGGGLVVDPSTLTDGIFLPRSAQWDQGPVWWDRLGREPAYITIDLGGMYSVESFVVQADDNDPYTLSYWDTTTADWQVAWDLPNLDAGNWGMQTRPNPSDDLQRYLLPEPLTTDKIRLKGFGPDRFLSVSEIQAWGNAPTPELSTWMLLACSGMAVLALRRRRKT